MDKKLTWYKNYLEIKTDVEEGKILNSRLRAWFNYQRNKKFKLTKKQESLLDEFIPIEETDTQIFDLSGVLFRAKFQNNYCYLKLRNDNKIELSFFKSDWKQFDKIEADYLETAIIFKIIDVKQTEIIKVF